jgi:hypothetical protein
MKIGKSYWSVSVSQDKVWNDVAVTEPHNNNRTNVMQKCKLIRADIKLQLNGKTEYATEIEARKAFAKLDQETAKFVDVNENFPVNLGLGWC